MSWGINPWGVSPWGGFGPGSILTGPAAINSRPFPTEITPLGVLSGGTNNLTLTVEAPAEDDFYNGYWLVYFGSKVVSRQVISYSMSRVVALSHDFPFAIPAAAEIFMFAPDEWVPDLLHVAVRPSYDKMLDLTTLSLLHNYSKYAFDGLRPHVTQGNPAAQHEGQVPSVGDFSFFELDPAAPVAAPLIATDDSFKGQVCTAYSGTGSGQERRIVRYDSATKRLYPDSDFDTPFDTTTRYRLEVDPQLALYNLVTPLSTTEVEVDAQYAGLALTHDGAANHRNVLVLRQGGNYNSNNPVQFQTLLHIEAAVLSAGQAGLVFGFQLGATPIPYSVTFEIMHDGGGGAGDLVLRVNKPNAAPQDTVLISAADPTAIVGLTLGFFCSYDPRDDKLRVTVNSLFPIPGSPLITNLELSGFRGTSDFAGSPLPQRPGGNLAFFGAGLLGAPVVMQYVRFAFLIEGAHIVKQGVVRGYLDGEVLSAFPLQTERNRPPLHWRGPWFPLAGGKSQPTSPVVIENDRLDDGTLVIRRDPLDSGLIPPTPYALVRYEPQLVSAGTRSFSFTTRIKAVEGEHLHWDAIGAAFGVLLGEPGAYWHIQIGLISDLGRQKVGLLLRDTGGVGLALEDYYAVDSEWGTDYRTYRLVYSEENGGDPYLVLFEDDKSAPIIRLEGAVLLSLLPDETTTFLNLDGVYFGLLAQPFSVELRHAFSRYYYNFLGYTPQLYFDQLTPTEPDGAPVPWLRVETVANTINYTREYDSRRVPINGKMTLESADSESYFFRSLADASLPAEHVLRQTDGFVAEFRVQLDGDSPPESVHSPGVQGRPGLWSGVGLYLDDGYDRIVFGFADGGSRGKFVFIAGGDPTDPTAPTAFVDVQSWVEASIRQPETWFPYLYNIDWSEEHLYRVERS
ncbi:MAG: hypothetical protein KDB07_01850, partial [Planctomycetes bacterium]|nr:hypothetical protein [Planctomycetota bacterium]